MSRTAQQASTRVWILLAVAMGSFVIAAAAGTRMLQLSAMLAGATLICVVIGLRLVAMLARRRDRRQEAALARLVGQDASPCFLTDDLGQICGRKITVVRG